MCSPGFVVPMFAVACLVPAGNDLDPKTRAESPVAAVAGDYYYGDGFGVNCSLTVKAEGRFSFVWRGCLGVYGRNEGGAEVVRGHLILKPEQPNEPGGFGGVDTDLILVRWGERSYLVPKDAGKNFCEAVNRGREPRTNAHGEYYLRDGDWRKEVAGPPDVPKEWKAFLRNGPAGQPK